MSRIHRLALVVASISLLVPAHSLEPQPIIVPPSSPLPTPEDIIDSRNQNHRAWSTNTNIRTGHARPYRRY